MWTSKAVIVKFEKDLQGNTIDPVYCVARRKWFMWKYLDDGSLRPNIFSSDKKRPQAVFYSYKRFRSDRLASTKNLDKAQQTLSEYNDIINKRWQQKLDFFKRVFLFGWIQPHGQAMRKAEIAQEIITKGN